MSDGVFSRHDGYTTWRSEMVPLSLHIEGDRYLISCEPRAKHGTAFLVFARLVFRFRTYDVREVVVEVRDSAVALRALVAEGVAPAELVAQMAVASALCGERVS